MIDYQMERPTGALKNKEQLLDLVQEAIDENKIVKLYYVHALGETSAITEYDISAKSVVYKKNDSSLFMTATYSDSLPKFETEFSLDDANIPANRYNSHYLFDNKRLAEEYVEKCKNSKELQKSCEAHWARCDEIFRDIDREYFGDWDE